ncbi:unnamed protein product [Moneuplotes crassus]|uniref:Cation-transporting P-type ATPase N-terminal domain-containing protein n=1 Tax=Euplotes crassus TaxID=5936 RepID=A0AAD1XFN6_EUPCR|nr:unnamed protein product [Moneuplotes crassus]
MIPQPGLTEASRILYDKHNKKYEGGKQSDQPLDTDEPINIEQIELIEGKQKEDIIDFIQKYEDTEHITHHKMTIEELEDSLETRIKDKNGLTTIQANSKLSQEKLRLEEELNLWLITYLKELNYHSYLLLLCVVLCFIIYFMNIDQPIYLFLGLFLLAFTFVSWFFRYYSTKRSTSLMKLYKKLIPSEANVIRQGEIFSIEPFKLVPGDLIQINEDTILPADVRIIESNQLKINNAQFTGEPEDLLMTVEPSGSSLHQATNFAFCGSSCTSGNGIGVLVNSGLNTSLASLLKSLYLNSRTSKKSLLPKEIGRLTVITSVIAVVVCILLFLLGLILDIEFDANILYSLGIILSNIPLGVFFTIASSFDISFNRMRKKKLFVNNLDSVETLGSTTCICVDKTGILTQNKMSVSSLWYDGELKDASVNYQTFEQSKANITLGYDIRDSTFKELLYNFILGTTASFNFNPTEKQIKRHIAKKLKVNPTNLSSKNYQQNKDLAENELREIEKKKPFQLQHTQGNQLESSLIKFAQPLKDIDECKRRFPIVSFMAKDEFGEETSHSCEISYNSDSKHSIFVRYLADYTVESSKIHYLVIIKGDPEVIWPNCNTILVNGEDRMIHESWNNMLKVAIDTLAKNGEKILAFANIIKSGIEVFDQFVVKDRLEYSSCRDFRFVGLVGIKDPLRENISSSVGKWKRAGSLSSVSVTKAIMFTDDYPEAAAFIAKRTNIFSEESKTNLDMIENGMSEEQAFEECDALVVDGEELSYKLEEQDLQNQSTNDDDNDTVKKDFLLDCVSKDEVVFTRITPSQKFLVVDACQRLGHNVAVTGNNLSDLSTMGIADTGIAMEDGSNTLKNAADMVILDNDFSTIINGIEDGRLFYDNLKKSIAFTLSSNIPEMFPFIFAILFQAPLPFTVVMILVIDIGVNIIPSISFAYENPEHNILLNKPRNLKHDHLINSKLISFSYLQIGVIQAFAGLYTYFIVMNDYGFKPSTLIGLAGKKGIIPNSYDEYNPSVGTQTTVIRGNTRVNSEIPQKFNFNSLDNNSIDLRLYFYDLEPSHWSECRWYNDTPKWWAKNIVYDDITICYRSEALRYAQTAYLISIVATQWANLIVCKTRSLSISQHGISNKLANFGVIFGTLLVVVLCYVPWFNKVLGTRMIAPPHFSIPSFPFCIIIFFYDEGRKMLLRSGIEKETGKLIGWVAQNTYY